MTLLHATLDPANLRMAWNAVADNAGAAGVDSVSITRWRRNWEERLTNLAIAVRGSQYKPSRLRVRRIPKKGSRDIRELRIPTVTDRVLQRAVLQQLLPLFEPQFHADSYGYRPGRGILDAVRAVTGWRKAGLTHVLNADIDDFFNQVDHDLLYSFLTLDLPDQSLHMLLKGWLTVNGERGIPMGAPISPLLANVYLHRLDVALAKADVPFVRYADDFIVLCSSAEQLTRVHAVVDELLQLLKLKLEPNKTHRTTFDDGFDFLGVRFEETWYWYLWEDKRIEIHDGAQDWLFGQYGTKYE